MPSWHHTPAPPPRRCPGENCGLAFDGDGQIVNRPSPSALRRWIQSLRKEASA